MDQEFLDAIRQSIKASQQRWVECQHEMKGIFHCSKCLSLHECWFVAEKAPIMPLHEKCHCSIVSIPTLTVKRMAKAVSAYSKYVPYLFNTLGIYLHGKEKMFAGWGYGAADAKWLQAEIERQALEKYRLGEYTLNKLDINGQRINIRIEIPRKDQVGVVSFTSGWMVEPKGTIRLITPYGGK